MAIQLLSLPTVTGGTTTGYPGLVNTIKDKINELATAMGISALTLSAALGAGSPASDLNTMVAKVNELVNYANGSSTPGDGGSGGTGTFPLKSGYDSNPKLLAYTTAAAVSVANGFTMAARFTLNTFNSLQYFFCNGNLDTTDEIASVFCQGDGALQFRYRLEGGQVAVAPVGLTITAPTNGATQYDMLFKASEAGGNVLFNLNVNGAGYPLTVPGTLHKTTTAVCFGGVYVNGSPYNAPPIGLLERMNYINHAFSSSEEQALRTAGLVPTQEQLQAGGYPIYCPGPTETASSLTTENLADPAHPLTVTRFS